MPAHRDMVLKMRLDDILKALSEQDGTLKKMTSGTSEYFAQQKIANHTRKVFWQLHDTEDQVNRIVNQIFHIDYFLKHYTGSLKEQLSQERDQHISEKENLIQSFDQIHAEWKETQGSKPCLQE